MSNCCISFCACREQSAGDWYGGVTGTSGLPLEWVNAGCLATADAFLLMVKYLINANAIFDRKQFGVLSHKFCRCVVLQPLKSLFPVNCGFSSLRALTITED